MAFQHLTPPRSGTQLSRDSGGTLRVPSDPIIPFIEGDGIGPDIWRAARHVIDAAVAHSYGDERHIEWFEIYAGEKAKERVGEWLPQDTLKAIAEYFVAIKGPLTTPVGGGFRSLNVTIRQALDLYACVRPVRYFRGVPSPMRHPERLDVVIFRENTEDVYAGYEWKPGSKEAQLALEFLNSKLGTAIRSGSGIGIKPMSREASERLVRKAIRHAIDHGRPSVTLVHKGNIMKHTEGAFRDWGYALAAREFAGETLSEEDLWKLHDGKAPAGKVLIKDRIADAMFQQLLLRPDEYAVIATPNLNGDYISDAAVAQVGGLGLGPGANMSDEVACFEATHGTAPKYADEDKVNPGSLILSGVMMLEHLGWADAADAIVAGLARTISQKRVTYDLERQLEGATLLKCSEFAKAIVENLGVTA